MEVFWTKTAEEHLQAIYDYISLDSTRYAQRVVDRITSKSMYIGSFPEIGEKVPEFDKPQIRQTHEGPYRIVYHLKFDSIDILAVLHGAVQSPWRNQE